MAREALNLINEELSTASRILLLYLVPWPLRHFATHRAKPTSKSIKDDLLRSHERTIYLPQQIGLQPPFKM